MIVLYCIVNGVAEKLQLATELYDYGAMVKVNAVAVIIFVAVWWIPHGPHKLTIGQDRRNAFDDECSKSLNQQRRYYVHESIHSFLSHYLQYK